MGQWHVAHRVASNEQVAYSKGICLLFIIRRLAPVLVNRSIWSVVKRCHSYVSFINANTHLMLVRIFTTNLQQARSQPQWGEVRNFWGEEGKEPLGSGPDPGFGFGGGQVERRRRKDRGVWWGGVHSPWAWGEGGAPSPENFYIFGSQNAYFGAFSGPSRVFVSAV